MQDNMKIQPGILLIHVCAQRAGQGNVKILKVLNKTRQNIVGKYGKSCSERDLQAAHELIVLKASLLAVQHSISWIGSR